MNKIIKNVTNIATHLKYQEPFTSKEDNEDYDKKTKNFVNYIFKEIKTICTAHHLSWPNEEVYANAKSSWFKAFKLAGIKNVEEIQRGLDKLRLLDANNAQFVPTSGQFIALCKPETKPQSDTCEKEVVCLPPYEKERRKEVGKKVLRELLDFLK